MSARDTIIVDLETTSLLVNEAIIRVFGAYDPYENKYFIYKWSDQALGKVMQIFEDYKYIITFNGAKYDMPILERHGVPIGNYKHIDVRQVYKARSLLIKRGGFKSFSLKNLIIDLGLDENGEGSKGNIDYEIFKKEQWDINEQNIIIDYLKQDLRSTWNLWKFVLDKFNPLSKYVAQKDIDSYKYITAPLPTYTYKVLCHMTGIEELYDEAPKSRNNPLRIITNPRKEINTNAALLRFTHLYPLMIQQFNLLSYDCRCCMTNEGKFHGKNFFTINGYYCQRNHGRIEKFLKTLYRATDPDSKLVGAIISSQIYEVISNSVYYSTYNTDVAKDLITLIKHQLKIMSRMFEERGYTVINIDIDNIFILVEEDNGKSVEELIIIKDNIIKYLQSKMPFKSEMFDLEFITKLKYLRFKKKSEKAPFMEKGQYLYITPQNKIVSKGLSNEDIIKFSRGVA